MQRAGFHLGNWSSGPTDAAAGIIRDCRAPALLAMENVQPSSLLDWARQPYARYLILRKHYAAGDELATGSQVMDWANGQAEMVANYLSHAEFRRLYDAGRLGVKVFNEPNMAGRAEGFGHDEDAMKAYNDLFPQAAQFIKDRFPKVKIVGYSLTPGNRDVYFSSAPTGTHYWLHGPEAAKDNPSPAEIETAKASCLTKAAQASMDWFGCHVYPHPGTWDTAYLGRRFEAYWRFLPDRLVDNTFILEASVADAAGQQTRADETRLWLDMLRGYDQIKAVTYWWLRPGDGTWERHFLTNEDGSWRPVAHVIEAFNAEAGTEPAPEPEPEPQPDQTRTTDFEGLPLSISAPSLSPGQWYWYARRVEVLTPEEGEGLHHIFVRTFDLNGNRVTDVPVRVTWPDDSVDGVTEEKPLEEHGDYNFPMSGQNWNPDEGPGPYSVQIDGEDSEVVSGMGMPHNYHYSLIVEFQEREHIVEEPEPADLRTLLLEAGEAEQVIEFNPDAAIQKAIFDAGFVPNSPEFEVEFSGKTFVAQRAEHLGTGEVRVYHAEAGDWGNVQYVVR